MARLCGYLSGQISDPARSNWSNDGPRPIKWSAWYPTLEARDAPVMRFFELGPLQPGAPLEPGGPFPVVLLSHGTGGTAEGVGWLARALALAGYVVLGPNHHGNTGAEPYTAEGFLCWWERMPDLSLLLETLEKEPPFAGGLDLSRVSAVGFSLGAYAALGLAGAVTSWPRFVDWRQREAPDLAGPPEFPDAHEQIPRLLDQSPAFQASMGRDGATYRDPRVRSVVAIAAPVPVQAFTPSSVAKITVPVSLITGGADDQAPFEACSGWLQQHNPGFAHVSMGPDVGHYTFLGFAKDPDTDLPFFKDAPGVDRGAVHAATIDRTLAALA